MGWATSEGFDLITRVLRRVWPIPKIAGCVFVLRYDDVIEVFANHAAFPVPYREKLAVIMGPGQEFFLGMDDTARYRRDTGMLRRAVRHTDVPELARHAHDLVAAKVAAAAGEIEIVQTLRDVSFGVLCPYFGIPAPTGMDLQVVATRLFQFQFADVGNDKSLLAKVELIAPSLRTHIDELMADRKSHPGPDDVLGRCLALQRADVPGTSDGEIRSALMGLVVGGPTQPPMVAPQALEQLLRRPDALWAAHRAAVANDDATLTAIVAEAMRLDPLAPGLFRRAAHDTTIARGTRSARFVAKDSKVFVAFRSAMRDPTFVPYPNRFDATRPADQYILFGHGLHTCFGMHINQAMLPAMLKPLLTRRNLRRASESDGRLSKRSGFADRLVVRYD